MDERTKKLNENLTKRIMRRVYFLWALRMMINPLFIKSLILAVFFWRSTEYISYTNVIANAPKFTDIERNAIFMRDALMHTSEISAILLIGIVVLLAWIVSDIIRKNRPIYF